MSDTSNFQPYTPQLGIAGSSYQLQMGKVNNYWAIRLVKGRDVLASKVFKDVPDPEELPLGNQITGWILSVLAIPNLNTYQIQKTVGFIRQKAQRTQEEQALKRQSGGKDEVKEAKLEKIADNVQVKRPQSQGWIKEEKSEEIKVSPEIASQSPGLVSSNEQITGKTTGAIESIKSKSLPEIPKGEGFVMQPFVYRRSGKSNRDAKYSEKSREEPLETSRHFGSIEARLAALEQKVAHLETENAELRAAINRL